MKLYKGLKKITSGICTIIFGANVMATVLPEVAHAENENATGIEYNIKPGQFGSQVVYANGVPCVTYTTTENDTFTNISIKACHYWREAELKKASSGELYDASVIDEIDKLVQDGKMTCFWPVLAYINNCMPNCVGEYRPCFIPANFRDAEELRDSKIANKYMQQNYGYQEKPANSSVPFGEDTVGYATMKMYCDLYGLDNFDADLVLAFARINNLDPYGKFSDLTGEQKFNFGETIVSLDRLTEEANQKVR